MKNFFTAFSCENSSLFVKHCPNLCLSDLSLFRDSGLDRTPKLTGHFGSGNIRKLFLSTFKVSGVPRKTTYFTSFCNRLPCAIDCICQVHCQLVIVDVRVVAGSVVKGVLPVDVAGSREVELIRVQEVHLLVGLITCAGCLVVITDHGPRAEVARALGHELLVDSGEGRLEGLEEERQKREEKEIGEERQPTHTQRTDDHACME